MPSPSDRRRSIGLLSLGRLILTQAGLWYQDQYPNPRQAEAGSAGPQAGAGRWLEGQAAARH